MMELIINCMVKQSAQVAPTLDLLMEESSDFELFNVVLVTAAELFGLLVLILCNVIGIRW